MIDPFYVAYPAQSLCLYGCKVIFIGLSVLLFIVLVKVSAVVFGLNCLNGPRLIEHSAFFAASERPFAYPCDKGI